MARSSEATFGWLAAIFAGGVIAGVLLWRRDRVRSSAPAAPPRTPEPEPKTPESSPPAPSGQVPSYSVASWLAYVQPLAEAAGVPVAFAQQWNQVESAGQPCAVGDRFVSFDGVNPRESGIAQLYGPDDYQALGLDPAALRVYCAPRFLDTVTDRKGNVVLDAAGKPRKALAFSQQHTRALTPAEMKLQAASLVGKIALAAKRANELLGGTWNRTGREFWAFVKLQHALPGLGANVIGFLRRPPTSWAELRATALSPAFLAYLKERVKARDFTYTYAEGFATDLANAEKTAAVVAPAARSAV